MTNKKKIQGDSTEELPVCAAVDCVNTVRHEPGASAQTSSRQKSDFWNGMKDGSERGGAPPLNRSAVVIKLLITTW